MTPRSLLPKRKRGNAKFRRGNCPARAANGQVIQLSEPESDLLSGSLLLSMLNIAASLWEIRRWGSL